VNSFFLLYALTISIELVLSLVMAIFTFLILSPASSDPDLLLEKSEAEARVRSITLEAALRDAFLAISSGRDDLAAIADARSLLARYQREAGGAQPIGD
jgi:hypothetical protein